MPVPIGAKIGRRDTFRAMKFQEPGCECSLFIACRLVPDGIGQQTFLVAPQHCLGRRGIRPFRRQLGKVQKTFGFLAGVPGYDKHRYALAPGAAGPAGTVQ